MHGVRLCKFTFCSCADLANFFHSFLALSVTERLYWQVRMFLKGLSEILQWKTRTTEPRIYSTCCPRQVLPSLEGSHSTHTPREGERGRADFSSVPPCRACDGQRQICLYLEIKHLRGDSYLEVWFLIVSESYSNFLYGKEQQLAWIAGAMRWDTGVSFKFLSE